jgi:hypothetical protein
MCPSSPFRDIVSRVGKASEGSCGKDRSVLKVVLRAVHRLATDRRTFIKPARSIAGRAVSTWTETGRGHERSIQAFVEDI